MALGALHSRAPKAIPSTIVINHPQEAVQRCELMDAFVSGDIDAAKVSRLGGLLLLLLLLLLFFFLFFFLRLRSVQTM